MKLIVKFKPTTLGFKKHTAFSFLPSCARIKSPARREFNTDRVGAGPRISIRRSSLEGVWQFSSVYLHFINRKQDLSFSSSSAGTEFHGDFGSHPHPSLQARRQKRAGQFFLMPTSRWLPLTFVDWSLVSKHDLVLGWNVLGIYEKNMPLLPVKMSKKYNCR